MPPLESVVIVSKKIYRTQRSFLLCSLLGILLPLALWIIYSCYAEGRVRAYGSVTITHNFNLIEESKPTATTAGGSRWGNANPHPEWTRKFHVWGRNTDGEQCFVDTDNLQKNFVTGQPLQKEGTTITTWYYLPKERGQWRWTVTAGRLSVTWLILFMAMVSYVGIKQD